MLTSAKYEDFKAVLLRDLEEAVRETLSDEDGLDPNLYSVSPDVSLWRRGSRNGAAVTSSNSCVGLALLYALRSRSLPLSTRDVTDGAA